MAIYNKLVAHSAIQFEVQQILFEAHAIAVLPFTSVFDKVLWRRKVSIGSVL